ncbi:MAG: DUF924 domain-containing protein [Acidiferrobacterales bacterium]|nr:DUF924 domain-containing protein [Acidiferrobacterales bacterium]
MNETIDSVLRYWFGESQIPVEINAQKKALWWSKNSEVDAEIEDRFSDLVDAVACGELDHWSESASGLLASIICTDQFPRNMYRGQSKSFSYDKIALGFARQAVAMRLDQQLPTIKRLFVYMPFEHSENLIDQEQAVSLMHALMDHAVEDETEMFRGFVRFAERHHEIIAEFGRFPHRNEILGRESTPKELAFLEQPGSSF